MKSAQASQEEINATFVKPGRKLFSARLLTLMLMIGLCMASVTSNASAQTCWEACQQTFISCLVAAGGDSVQEARCQNDYDKCGQDCM
jgi:hypothetical protein